MRADQPPPPDDPHPDEPDPIAELLRALECDGRPALPWLVRWSQHGAEPVAAAWAHSRDADAMTALLQRANPRALARATAEAERSLGPWWYTRAASEIALALRRAVPDPPTLESLLRALKPR